MPANAADPRIFSRLDAVQRNNMQNPSDLVEADVRDLESDSQSEQNETQLQQLRQDVIAEVAERYLIFYERFNLCELSQNKSKKFNRHAGKDL